MYRRRLVCEGTPPVFVFFIVVAILRCESCRLGTAQDRRRGGHTVESDQKKRFVVVSLAIIALCVQSCTLVVSLDDKTATGNPKAGDQI